MGVGGAPRGRASGQAGKGVGAGVCLAPFALRVSLTLGMFFAWAFSVLLYSDGHWEEAVRVWEEPGSPPRVEF